MKRKSSFLSVLKRSLVLACILSLFSFSTYSVSASFEQVLKPKIVFFKASKNNIEAGESVTLSWNVLNAYKVDILGIEKVVECVWPIVGKTDVQPSLTTTYILKATGYGGTVSASVTVNVNEKTSPAVINSFSVSEDEILEGDSTTLTWDVSDAISVTINGSEVEAKGSLEVEPSETTTYVLEAIGTDKLPVTKSVTVKVILNPVIKSFTATETEVEKGTLVILEWDTENAVSCEIVTDDGLILADRPADGQIGITPNSTKTYTLIAYNEKNVSTKSSITIVVE